MEAKLHRRGDVTVVHMAGKLDLERNQAFREICLKELRGRKVIFCLNDLQFVGSSGIQLFFRTLSDIHAVSPFGVKVSGVKADFMRILQYMSVPGLEFHEHLEGAVNSFITGIPGGFQLGALVPVEDGAAEPVDSPVEDGDLNS